MEKHARGGAENISSWNSWNEAGKTCISRLTTYLPSGQSGSDLSSKEAPALPRRRQIRSGDLCSRIYGGPWASPTLLFGVTDAEANNVAAERPRHNPPLPGKSKLGRCDLRCASRVWQLVAREPGPA
ncbi:hypothetical protein PMIN03_011633 [Paraphaeosphaeria minitans]